MMESIFLHMNLDFFTNSNFESIEDITARYPDRLLPLEIKVTRVAPSPTGFTHIGSVYAALICERIAHQSDGIFFLRIEDTDKKREVPGSAEKIVKAFNQYGIHIDEGMTLDGSEIGAYGPYLQSSRKSIYRSFAKHLLDTGKAYPCFCTPEELDAVHKSQEAQKIRPGYYGQWAVCRNKTKEEVAKLLSEQKPYVVRFRSEGNFETKIVVQDLIKGERELSQNDQDVVMIKSDGLPTYHFAHAIDDHFMGTTDVIRGDEWFSSLPLHIELFETLGFKLPRFGHFSPIQKMEGSSRRKLSKRKDPEADVTFYESEGYPVEAVVEYLLNLANSNFEDWRRDNPFANNREFKIDLNKLPQSGSLFDIEKLHSISKEVIARFTAKEVYERALNWTTRYDTELASELEKDPVYATSIFDIERSGTEKVRKDIAIWKSLHDEVGYFFDELFKPDTTELKKMLSFMPNETTQKALELFFATYDEKDTKEVWLEKMRTLASQLGYAPTTKELKSNPEKYKGSIAEVTKIFRILLTGKEQTPDLYEIMKTMGSARVSRRLKVPA